MLRYEHVFWSKPQGARVHHWFDLEGQSMCGKYGFFDAKIPADATKEKPEYQCCQGCTRRYEVRNRDA